jgi:deoxyadenosine/deoxycytidine kinase
MYIAIAGNIGSGKTTLTEIIAARYGAKAYYEDTDNPYLVDFYEDMERWAFNLQMYFLGKRIHEASDKLRFEEDLVQDRTVYEDAYIFASNVHDMGLMSSRDFDTYMGIFNLIHGIVPQPDILVYLKAGVPRLIQQIKKRGRAYEAGIMEDYLERLNKKYNFWIDNIYRGEVLTVDIDSGDFIENPDILKPLFARLDEFKVAEGKQQRLSF